MLQIAKSNAEYRKQKLSLKNIYRCLNLFEKYSGLMSIPCGKYMLKISKITLEQRPRTYYFSDFQSHFAGWYKEGINSSKEAISHYCELNGSDPSEFAEPRVNCVYHCGITSFTQLHHPPLCSYELSIRF